MSKQLKDFPELAEWYKENWVPKGYFIPNAVLDKLIELGSDIEFLCHQLDTMEHEQSHELVQKIRDKHQIKRRWETVERMQEGP